MKFKKNISYFLQFDQMVIEFRKVNLAKQYSKTINSFKRKMKTKLILKLSKFSMYYHHTLDQYMYYLVLNKKVKSQIKLNA